MINILRRVASLAVAFIMVFTIMFSVSPFAAYAGTNELSASKVAEELGGNEYNIIFSLPSKQGEVQKDADVVILMDKSSVKGLAGLKEAAASFIDKLVNKQQTDGVNFKVAVVWFNFDVHNGDATSTGLVNLSAGNAEAIKNSIKDGGGTGSNLHGGVLRAKSILDADTTVSDNNKFMIVATDLAGYVTDGGGGTGLIRYNGGSYVGNGDFGSKYASLNFANVNVSSIDNLIRNKTLINGVAADDSMLTTVGSAAGEFPLGLATGNTKTWADYMNADCPTMFEKSIYLTGNLFLEMKAKGYNLVAINQPYGSGGGYTTTNKAFQEWFGQNAGKRYDLSSGITIDYAFNDISSDVFDFLGKGTITDVIADDFEMKGPETMKVVLSGTVLAKTKISENKYGFGTKKNGVYQYEATYDPATKTVKFDINKSVSRYELLQFVFTEKYVGNDAGTGKLVPTNKSAQIDYMSSLDVENGVGNYNKNYMFDSPMVRLPLNTYSVNYKFISVTEGETLPAAVTKLLPTKRNGIQNGTLVTSATVQPKTVKTSDGTWKFTGWDKSSKTIESADVTFIGSWVFEKDGAGGDNPKTGDNAPLGIMFAIIALCGAGIAGMTVKRRKQSK